MLTCPISVAVCKGFYMAYFDIEDDDSGSRIAWQAVTLYIPGSILHICMRDTLSGREPLVTCWEEWLHVQCPMSLQ